MSESKLTDLIERLKAATEGSRELDTAVFLAAEPGWRQWGGGDMACPKDEPDHWGFTKEQNAAYLAEWRSLPAGAKDEAALNAKHGTPWFSAEHQPGEIYDGRFYSSSKNANRRSTPHLTTSLDAALALVERTMVPHLLEVEGSWEPSDKGVWPAWSVRWYPGGTDRDGKSWHARVGTAATPALALCVTLLAALQGRSSNQ